MAEKRDILLAFFGDRFHKRVFLITLTISVGLIITSFFTPPMWIIDGSVLAAVGELFGFAALAEITAAVERGHRASITHGNTTLTVGDKDKEENEDEL